MMPARFIIPPLKLSAAIEVFNFPVAGKKTAGFGAAVLKAGEKIKDLSPGQPTHAIMQKIMAETGWRLQFTD